MPSSLTGFLSRASVFSTIPPVSVCGTVTRRSTLRSFSGQCGIGQSASPRGLSVLTPVGIAPMHLTPGLPTGFDCHFQPAAGLASCVPPSLTPGGTGILNLFPIAYAFRPRLRGRLTLGGRTFPRKPWDFGVPNSHRDNRYSCPHHHFHAVHPAFRQSFSPHGTLLYLPTPPQRSRNRGFGSRFESRLFSAQDHSTSQLLRTV